MICPRCKGKTKVKLTIPYSEEGEHKVIRERHCEDPRCGHKFQTIEKVTDESRTEPDE